MSNKVLFILFPGNGGSKNDWNIINKKEPQFLDELQKLGKIYTFTPKYNNIWWYAKGMWLNDKSEYKGLRDIIFDSNDIDLTLNDFNVEKLCKNIYDQVKNFDGKYVLIGHSMGCVYLYKFAELYTSKCLFGVFLDGSSFGKISLQHHVKDKTLKQWLSDNKSFGEITNEELKQITEKVKLDDKESIQKISQLAYYYVMTQKPYNKNIKLPIPIISFRDIEKLKGDIDEQNKYDESEMLKKNNSTFEVIYLYDKTHFIHKKSEVVLVIIDKIKEYLQKYSQIDGNSHYPYQFENIGGNIDYRKKYIKYKTKYVSKQIGGKKNNDIIILHSPNPMYSKEEIIEQYKHITDEIEKINTVHHYFFKFGISETPFKLKDILFEKTSKHINKWFQKMNITKGIIICLEESSPFGLHFVDTYPEKCHTIICYPLRLYTKESLDRSIWKFKNQKGWDKYISQKYSLDDYLLNINEERLSEILKNRDAKEEKNVLYNIYNHQLRKQYDKIPNIFKVPTHLFSRLDLDAITTIESNLERKEIADIKGYFTKDDVLMGSMVWNFARTKYDNDLMKANEKNNNLRIHYIIGAYKLGNFGKQADMDLLDCIKLVIS